jgi:hypothetical protein
MRNRKIIKYGNTWVIKLDTADVNDYGLVEGDIVDIEELGFLIQINNKKTKKKGVSVLLSNHKEEPNNKILREVKQNDRQT